MSIFVHIVFLSMDCFLRVDIKGQSVAAASEVVKTFWLLMSTVNFPPVNFPVLSFRMKYILLSTM